MDDFADRSRKRRFPCKMADMARINPLISETWERACNRSRFPKISEREGMERKYLEKNRQLGYTSRGCPLFRKFRKTFFIPIQLSWKCCSTCHWKFTQIWLRNLGRMEASKDYVCQITRVIGGSWIKQPRRRASKIVYLCILLSKCCIGPDYVPQCVLDKLSSSSS